MDPRHLIPRVPPLNVTQDHWDRRGRPSQVSISDAYSLGLYHSQYVILYIISFET